MRLLVLFASLLSVFGYSAGVDTCMNGVNHGSWGAGTPFTLQLLSGNQTVTAYTPHTNYSLTLTGNSAFRGYITTSGVGSDFVSASSQALGVWHLDTTDKNVRMMRSCAGITQVSGGSKRQAKALWTAPESGLVTFHSIITVSQNGNNYRASLVVPLATQNVSVPSFMPSITTSVTTTKSVTPTKTSSASEWKSSSATRSKTMSISVSGSVGTSSTSSSTITESMTESITASSSITPSTTNSPPITPTESPDGTESTTPLPSVTSSITPSQMGTQSGSQTQTPNATANETPVPVVGGAAPNEVVVNRAAAIGVVSVLGVLASVALVGTFLFNRKTNRKSLSSRNIIDFVKPSDVTSNPLKTEMKTEEFRTIV